MQTNKQTNNQRRVNTHDDECDTGTLKTSLSRGAFEHTPGTEEPSFSSGLFEGRADVAPSTSSVAASMAAASARRQRVFRSEGSRRANGGSSPPRRHTPRSERGEEA